VGNSFEVFMGPVLAALFVASLALIFVGLGFLYGGEVESATVELLDFQLPSVIVGRGMIAIGIVGLVVIARVTVRSVQDFFRPHHGPDNF
jgi:hypothetical protein